MPAASSIVRQLVEQAFNLGNLAVVDELVLLDAASHTPGWGLPANRLGLKQLIANLRAAFPDLHCTVADDIGRETRSAALWMLRGTHQGPFLGNMPSGRRVEVLGFVFAHIKNGRISEGWLLIDQISMLQQIGAVPPPSGNFAKDPIHRRP
jgi:predicted ester cyclase